MGITIIIDWHTVQQAIWHDVIAASGAIIGGFGMGSAAMINALGLCITYT